MSHALKTLFRNPNLILGLRRIHTTTAVQKEESSSEFSFRMAGYHKYGLLKDDFLNELDEDVAEAIRRMPIEMQMNRLYRAMRATQCDINHNILPEDQWTKYDDDHNYLTPYVNEVKAERLEREEWEANY